MYHKYLFSLGSPTAVPKNGGFSWFTATPFRLWAVTWCLPLCPPQGPPRTLGRGQGAGLQGSVGTHPA